MEENNHAWKETIIMHGSKQSCMEGNNNHLLFFQIVVFISEPFMQFNNDWGARLARTYS
jgi:hypothetical protein